MKLGKVVGLALAASVMSGCATGLNSMQEREYQAMKTQRVLVEEKSPGTGAALGVLPGGGSFYVREPGYGVVNLLFWPLSILWDPISGYEGAKAINYDLTKHKLKRDMEREIASLDDKLTTGQIDNLAYVTEKNKIQGKYSFD